ncbi:MAG: hypothetical protein ACO3NZ_05040, partial [Pirellulales bacterium]
AFPTASQSRSGGRGQHELITKNMPTLGASLRHAGEGILGPSPACKPPVRSEPAPAGRLV